jgi:hypothetical protein
MLTSTTSVAQHVGVQDMAMVAAAQAQHAMEEGFGRRGRRDVCQAESAYAGHSTGGIQCHFLISLCYSPSEVQCCFS